VLPGSIVTDIILIYLIPVLFFGLFYVVAPYLIVFYIKIHKFFYWLLRRPSKYGIFKLGTRVSAGRLMARALVVSLFSFSISALIVSLGGASLFRAGVPLEPVLFEAEAIFLGTFILCSFMIIIFFPVWLLEDSGLVSYRVFHEERMPADIQGVHSIYYYILLGYAGFSTILTLVSYITQTLEVVGPTDAAMLTPIILIILPLLLTGLIAIPIYLYERFFPRTSAKLHKHLEKFNFPDIRIPKFEELKE
jgi:hypothetical protein